MILLLAQAADSPVLLWVGAAAGLLGGSGGFVAVYRVLTIDRRAQRMAEEKASKEELEQVRTENRRLDKELREVTDREYQAQRDKQASDRRLTRVEDDLAIEREETAKLRREVETLRRQLAEARGHS